MFISSILSCKQFAVYSEWGSTSVAICIFYNTWNYWTVSSGLIKNNVTYKLFHLQIVCVYSRFGIK